MFERNWLTGFWKKTCHPVKEHNLIMPERSNTMYSVFSFIYDQTGPNFY